MTGIRKGVGGLSGQVRRFAAWIVAITMLVATIPAQAVLAQDTGLVDDSTYVLESGQTVAWSGAWEFEPEFSGIEQGIETVLLNSGLAFFTVLTMPAGLDIEVTRDQFLEGFVGEFDSSATIDRGAYEDLSYSLDLVSSEDVELGTFILFRAGSGDTPTFATFFAAPVQVFADQFTDAQASIQIDGAGIFNGVGGEGLQDLLESSSGSSGDGAPDDGGSGDTPAGDDAAETPESGDGGGSGDKLGGADDPAGDGAGDDGAAEDGSGDDQGDDTQDSPPGETGLVDDNTFVSPVYGVEATWDGTYALDTEAQSPVVENGEGGIDSVSLVWTGDGPAFMTITFMSAGDATDVTPVMNSWTSEDFVSNAISSPDGGIVMADNSATLGAVIYLDFTDDDVPIIYYREAHYLEAQGAFVLISFFTVPQLLEQTVTDAQNGIAIDGEPALAFYSVQELLDEFGG